MKKTIRTTFTLFLTALILTGFTACGNKPVQSTTAGEKEAEATIAISTGTVYETTVNSNDEAPASVSKEDVSAPAGAFKAAGLVKIGEHTYYQDGLFEGSDRDKKYKDHMISQLEQADKDLHDDVYVHGIGESEERGEFRFFGNMMSDGVIFDSGVMTCWYEKGKGSYWEIDYSKFRRTDFSKSGLLPAEDFFGEIYKRASKAEKIINAYEFDGSITGTYLLIVDANGNLFYRFTINKYSTVEVDAKTGEIIRERYWDGVYTAK